MQDGPRKAFLQTLPVMAGYLVLGIGFGVILRQKGFGPLWAFAMSAFINLAGDCVRRPRTDN